MNQIDGHLETSVGVGVFQLEEADVSHLQLILPGELLPAYGNAHLATSNSERGLPHRLFALQLKEECFSCVWEICLSIFNAESLSESA